MQIELVSLIVDEYDPAIEFCTDVLGLEGAEDSSSTTTSGRTRRWVVVRPPEGGSGIVLARAEGDEQTAMIGHQFAGRVGLFLRVDNLDGTPARIEASGCEPVRDEPHGRVCVFQDPWGNVLGSVRRGSAVRRRLAPHG